MNEIQNHPDLDDLLQLVDESAPSRSNRWVRRHVAACWKCRSHLEELQETIREFARYHEKVLLPNLPQPPMPWLDLRAKMRQFDEANPLPDLLTRARAHLSLPQALSLKKLLIGGILFTCVALAFTLSLRIVEPTPVAPHPSIAPVTGARIAPVVEPGPAPSPRRPPTAVPLALSPADTEVRIFAALHRIGADLGDPIEISSDSKGNFTVVGVGLPSPRQAEVRDALASLPDVAVDFSDASPARGSLDRNARALRFEAGRSPFEAALQRLLGGQAGQEAYSNQVLDESDAVLTRAHALQNLADRFPPAKREKLQERQKAMLDEISSDHRTALRDHARKLESLVAPVREALNAPPFAAAHNAGSPLAAAQRMDRVLSVIFGVAATNLTPAELIVELSQSSAGLQNAIQ